MATADTTDIIAAWPVEVGAPGSVDDAYRYLTRAVGLQDDLAIYELNQKLVQGGLRLYYRRTDAAGIGQAGVVPCKSWSLQLLCVDVDRGNDAERDNDAKRGPLDWATGENTVANDGRAFVRLLGTQGPGQTYDLAISMAVVRTLWWPNDVPAAAAPSLPPTPPPTRRKETLKFRGDAVAKFADYVEAVLRASPGCKTMTVAGLQAACQKEFKVAVPVRKFRKDCWEVGLARVPEAVAIWTKAGAPKRS
jgi:hypothetical protein